MRGRFLELSLLQTQYQLWVSSCPAELHSAWGMLEVKHMLFNGTVSISSPVSLGHHSFPSWLARVVTEAVGEAEDAVSECILPSGCCPVKR